MRDDTHLGHRSGAELLLRYLQRERENLVATLEGLGDYDVRRPMTPTGTSLLGLVKHMASVEIAYLGDCVGRSLESPLPWDNEQGYEQSADMWAKADESREWILDLYRRSWTHGDESVRTLGLEAGATVPWWPENRRDTTLGYVVVHLLAETAHTPGTPTSCARPSTAARARTGTRSVTRPGGEPTSRGCRLRRTSTAAESGRAADGPIAPGRSSPSRARRPCATGRTTRRCASGPPRSRRG